MSLQEAKAATRLFVQAMLLAASYTLMRSVGDSLFLARVGNESLATVFVMSGVATAILGAVWIVWTRRLPLERSLKFSGTAAAFLTFLAWMALPDFHHSWWLLVSIYILTELKGCVNSINIVSSANLILGGHASRRAWTRMGLGAPLAGVATGLFLGLNADLDPRSWLLISACLDLVSILPLHRAGRLMVSKGSNDANAVHGLDYSVVNSPSWARPEYVSSSWFRGWMGTLIASKVVVLTLITFLWKTSVNDFFMGNEQSLTRYFAGFYAATGVFALLLQWFATAKLIKRRRLTVPILVMPLGFFILTTAMLFGSGALFLLVILTAAKSFEVWRRSVHDTALGLLYTHLRRELRRSAISWNTAIIKPLAEVGASLVLVFTIAAWHPSLVLVAVVVWLISGVALLQLIARTATARSAKQALVLTKPNRKARSELV